jgi:hypothetical protein
MKTTSKAAIAIAVLSQMVAPSYDTTKKAKQVKPEQSDSERMRKLEVAETKRLAKRKAKQDRSNV